MVQTQVRAQALNPTQVEQFNDSGYVLVRNFLPLSEIEEIRNEASKIISAYPDVPSGLVGLEPDIEKGLATAPTPELAVRKLARMAVHNPYFRNLAFHASMVGIVQQLMGPNVTLYQSMLLMKPPRYGVAKVWHQDNAYFRLAPANIVGFWVACDDADEENGCMHVVPGTHRQGLVPHGSVGQDYGMTAPPKLQDAVPCRLPVGGALIFHGELFHFTPHNRSDRRRRALQHHYGSSHCRPRDDSPFGPFTGELVVAGPDPAES